MSRILIDAIKERENWIVEGFIQKGVAFEGVYDTGYGDQKKYSAVFAAVEFENLAALKLCIDAGADVNARRKDNVSALMLSVTIGFEEYFNVLMNTLPVLKLDCQCNQLGYTALHYAIEQKNVYCVKRLIKAGIDVSLKNDFNMTALEMACSRGVMPAVPLLLNDTYDRRIQYDGGRGTLLMIAVREGYFDIAEYLLDNGFDLYAVNRSDKTVFDIALEGLKGKEMHDFLTAYEEHLKVKQAVFVSQEQHATISF